MASWPQLALCRSLTCQHKESVRKEIKDDREDKDCNETWRSKIKCLRTKIQKLLAWAGMWAAGMWVFTKHPSPARRNRQAFSVTSHELSKDVNPPSAGGFIRERCVASVQLYLCHTVYLSCDRSVPGCRLTSTLKQSDKWLPESALGDKVLVHACPSSEYSFLLGFGWGSFSVNWTLPPGLNAGRRIFLEQAELLQPMSNTHQAVGRTYLPLSVHPQLFWISFMRSCWVPREPESDTQICWDTSTMELVSN